MAESSVACNGPASGPVPGPKPKPVVDVVSGLFLVGALYAWREAGRTEIQVVKPQASRHGTILTALLVILLAEWAISPRF